MYFGDGCAKLPLCVWYLLNNDQKECVQLYTCRFIQNPAQRPPERMIKVAPVCASKLSKSKNYKFPVLTFLEQNIIAKVYAKLN